MNRLKTVIVLVLLLATSFSILIPTVSNAASPTSYVAITLTNSQTTATPQNFTQLIKVNWSAYATDLNANISNVRFYNSTSFSASTELAGWIEDNNTTTATSSNVWVNLSDTIVPASSTATIYMAFLPTTSSWSLHWGLAPQLDNTYGKHDNGANVFSVYFNGNTPTSDFSLGSGVSLAQTSVAGPTGATINVLEYSGDSSQEVGLTYTSKKLPPGNYTGETSFSSEGGSNDIGVIGLGTASTATSAQYEFSADTQFAGSYLSLSQDDDGSMAGASIGGTSTSVWHYEWFSYTNGASSANLYAAPQLYNTAGGISGSVTNYIPIGSTIYETVSSNGATYLYYNWLRIRETPPAGIMPSVTFGSLTTVSTSGYQISFQQTSLPSGTKWGIRLNNTTSVTWLNTTGQYDNITGLKAGSYIFQVINATGYASNPYTGLLTIVSSNLTQIIDFTGYSITFTESGLPSGDTWYVKLSDQLGLSESSTGQKLSGTTSSLTTHEPNGTYTFTYQTSDKRYSGGSKSFTINGASITEDVTFAAVLYYLNFTQLSKPTSVEWGVNVSGTIKTGYGNISFQLVNGTYYWNASAINGSFTHPIGWWRLTNGSGVVLLHNESSFVGMKIVINGKNYNDNITFARAYNITFEEVGIANTFQWDVNLSNGLGITLDKHIIVSDNVTQVYSNSTEGNYTNATYTGSIQLTIYGSTGVRYINLTASTSLSDVVNGKDIVYIYRFITQYYLKTESIPSAGGASIDPPSGWINASSQVTLAAQPNSGYEFTGWIGKNVSSYTGMGYYSSGEFLTSITMTNPITEEYTFNNFVPLTFYMQNLTSGVQWGIKLTDNSGLVQWSNTTSYYVVFDVSIGNYNYAVTGIKSLPQSGSVTLSTASQVFLQYLVTTYDVNFQETGLPTNQNWGIKVFDSLFSVTANSNANIINFELPDGSYEYQAVSITGYISNNSSGAFTVDGTNLTLFVNWTEGNGFILLGVRYFVPIYINDTPIQVPKGTQIPLNVNWTKYTRYENVNLSNVLFMNASFQPLYAWIQYGANSSSQTSVVWVKILSTYVLNSSHIIYLTWLSKTRNNLNKYGYLGEEPQLSKTYGQYNNIAMVMNPGLVEQYYTNSSASFYNNQVTGDISASTMDAASFNENSYLTDGGIRFYATEPYYFSSQTNNANGSVYLGYSSSFQVGGGIFTTTYDYKFYGIENNLLMNYQAGWGFVNYPGTWPSPPIVYTSYPQAWFVKYQGFVIQSQPQTLWYEIGDGSLSISNSTSYFNNWASSSPISLDPGGGSLGSVTSKIQGSAEFSMIFQQVPYVVTSDTSAGFVTEWYSTRDLWQTWTNYPLSFYSPNPVFGLQNVVASATFGVVSSSYNAFYEYGLPVNTNWSIAISGPGFSKLYTTNSNLIYTYLPNETYLYTVGSYINGSYRSGIDGNFIPSPGSGHVIVTGAFTVQVIIFSLNKVLKYNLEPEQASGTEGNISLPILVTNIQGLPASQATINNVIKYLNATLIAKQESSTTSLTWKISSAKTGMIVIFLNLTPGQLSQIKNGTAVVSFVSGFQLGTIEEVAAGVAGTNVFSSVSGPPVTNTTLPSSPGVSSINQIISYLAYLETTSYGRALYLTLVLLGILAYTVTISKHVKSRKKSP